MSRPLNTDPFMPWNNPMHSDNPFAPHNNPMYADDPFAPWNDPASTLDDLSNEELKAYGLSTREDEDLEDEDDF